MNMLRSRIMVASVLALGTARAPGQPVGNAFSYQGRLRSNGQAATGLHDLRFRLFDSASAGAQVGPGVCCDNVAVAPDGTFVVSLDFGAVFGAAARFLQIDVRKDTGLACGNASGFVGLTPRQPVTGAPFAIGPWEILPGNQGLSYPGSVGIGTTAPLGPLDVRSGGGSYVRVDPVFGDLHVNGGIDGYFGIYNQGVAGGRTEIIGTANSIVLSAANAGWVGIGATGVAGTRLYVAGDTRVQGDVTLVGAGSRITVPATARFKTIHGSAFLPRAIGDANPEGESFYDVAGVRDNHPGSVVEYLASVELPHGAQVTNVILSYLDDFPVHDIEFRLGRTAIASGATQNIAVMTSTGASTAVRTVSPSLIANFTVDNQNYAYWASATLQGNAMFTHRVVAVRIDYTVSQPLP